MNESGTEKVFVEAVMDADKGHVGAILAGKVRSSLGAGLQGC